MVSKRVVNVVVLAGSDMADATLSRMEGGAKLDRGLRDIVAEGHPDIDLMTHFRPVSGGFSDMRRMLSAGESPIGNPSPDVVILSIAHDVLTLPSRGATPAEAVAAVQQDLTAVVNAIKEDVGAHVFVANVSTVDPAENAFSYAGLDEEPFTLRAHRLALMLVAVSQSEGISIIDVDRLIAEKGADKGVVAAADYSSSASADIGRELARILEDYGFFDDRPLLAQTGAKRQAE